MVRYFLEGLLIAAAIGAIIMLIEVRVVFELGG